MAPTVLVTGGTGFVGGHCVKLLLAEGYSVRATVRNPSSAKCAYLRKLPNTEKLTLVGADLTDSLEHWTEVVKGCDIVMHTASPFQIENVPPGKEEEYFMLPAVQGTEVVVKACLQMKVKRLVLTSSVAAVAYGHKQDPKFVSPGPDDSVWTDIDGLVLPNQMYIKSKTAAEKRAWELVEGSRIEFATVNPVLVTGPILSAAGGGEASQTVARILLQREYPLLPNLPMALVDVRDVAKLHLLCATRPEAVGKRHIACCTPSAPCFPDLGRLLASKGHNVPTGRMPTFIIQTLACFDRKLAMVVKDVDTTHHIDARNGGALLEGKWIPWETSMADMAQSMIDLKIVPKAALSRATC